MANVYVEYHTGNHAPSVAMNLDKYGYYVNAEISTDQLVELMDQATECITFMSDEEYQKLVEAASAILSMGPIRAAEKMCEECMIHPSQCINCENFKIIMGQD